MKRLIIAWLHRLTVIIKVQKEAQIFCCEFGLLVFPFVLAISTRIPGLSHYTLLNCYLVFSFSARLCPQTLRAERGALDILGSFLKEQILCLSWQVLLTSLNLYPC